MTVGAIGQVARAVDDIERAKAWYAGVLGLPHLYTFGKLSFFDCGGVVFTDVPHVVGTHPDGTQEWMAFFKDCDGKFLALMTQVKPA